MDFNKRFEIPENTQNLPVGKNWVIDKFYGLDHLVNRLYIHWDMLSKCNYDCSYCYAKRFYKSVDKWGAWGDFEKQQHIIKCISYSKLPVFLGLQGGEPTIDKNFLKIIKLIETLILDKHIDNRLYITSNVSNNILLRLEQNPKVFILTSFHPEFSDAKHFVNVLKNLRFKTRVNLMLINNPNHWDTLHFVYNELRQIEDLQIHPHFIYTDHSRGTLDSYSRGFYKEFGYMKSDSKEFIIETKTREETSKEEITQGVVISDYEVFERDLNHFYGFECYNNNHEVDFEGKVKILCKNSKISLFDNPLYFRNIQSIEPMTCPHQNCNCDGLLKTLKIRM